MEAFPALVPPDPEPEVIEETKEEEVPEPEVKIFITEPTEVVPVEEIKQNEEPWQERAPPPPKKKRIISQKQKDHLAKARVASAAKKRAKTAEKQAIEHEVRAEVARRAPPPPTYVPPPPQEDGFESFLENMSKFKQYEIKYNNDREQAKAKTQATKNKVEAILSPPPKPVPPRIIAKPIKNVYADAFSW